MRIYRGFLIEKQFPSGIWGASNYSEGYGFLRADTLEGIKRAIRIARSENSEKFRGAGEN